MKINNKQLGKYRKVKIFSFDRIKALISKLSLVFKYFEGNENSQMPTY